MRRLSARRRREIGRAGPFVASARGETAVVLFVALGAALVTGAAASEGVSGTHQRTVGATSKETRGTRHAARPEAPRVRHHRSLDDPQHDRPAALDLPACTQTRPNRGQPNHGARAPRDRRAPRPIASPTEAAQLLDALAAWPSTTGDVPLWATALYAGLRRGELQALESGDIDRAEERAAAGSSGAAIECPAERDARAGLVIRVPAAAR